MKSLKFFIPIVLLSALIMSSSALNAKDAVTAKTKKNINAQIEQIMKQLNTVGLGVAAVSNGKIIYANSWGYKDLENKKMLRNDDIFRIASISKSFTATSIMQLIEQGKMSLDEDISDLVGFKVRNPKYPDVKITVKMMLSHTSSINDSQGYFTLDGINPAKSKDYAKAFNDYCPGEGYEYCNLNYNTLGTVLEKISGERFDQYIVNHILKPLKVYGGYWVASLDKSKFVNLYEWNYKTNKYEVQPEAYDPRTKQIAAYKMGESTPIFSPTGGMKLSPTGLATVMMMHIGLGTSNGVKIISKESSLAMQTPVFGPDDDRDQYGFALRKGDDLLDGYTMIGHTGGAYGVFTSMFWNEDRTFGFVVMTNGCSEKRDHNFLSIHRMVDKCLYDNLIKGTSADTRKAEIAEREKEDAAIGSEMKEIMKKNNSVGVGVAVVKGGKIIYRRSFGYKNLEDKVPLEDDDVFRIASVSKSFTSTSIMQLVEQGKMSLDDDISDLVGFTVRNPNFPDVKITPYMLLSHTSSLNDSEGYFNLDVINPSKSKTYKNAYSNWRPGTKYDYCNLNFNMLGTVLEKVSGERFDKYIPRHILRPLYVYGGYNVRTLDSSRFVRLYEYENGKPVWHPEAYAPRTEEIKNYKMGYSTPIFSPTGGMKLSPSGLATVMMMHMGFGKYQNVRIIKPESALLMQSRFADCQLDESANPDNCEQYYGFAIMTTDKLIKGETLIGHTGDAYGVRTSMFWNQARTFGIVVITNSDNYKYENNFASTLFDVNNCLYNNLIKNSAKKPNCSDCKK